MKTISYHSSQNHCYFFEVYITKQINYKRYAAISQSLVQLARPHSIICPLQVTLGIELHHKIGSEFMVELLYKFGFSSLIKEVQTLEKMLCDHHPFEQTLNNLYSNPLYSTDYADFNISTIDVKNTLHEFKR